VPFSCAGQEPLRRTSARSSALSLMLRTASARPCPAAPERVAGTPEDRAELRAGGSTASGGAVIAAGMSTTVASSFKSGMPRTRARTDAWTRAPSDKRLPRSGAPVSTTGARLPSATGVTTVEPYETPLRPRHLGMAFRPGLGVDRRHESPLAPSVRRRSDEIPALPAVRTARPPATKPAFSILPLVMLPLSESSESLPVSRSRSR